MFTGIPAIWTSNFKDVSTTSFALCILKENCHPLSKHIITVVLLFGLNPIYINVVGNCINGTFIDGSEILLGRFNVPNMLND